MASIQKTARGYRAQVKKHGVRESRVFGTKREASAWAWTRETEITDQARKRPAELHTLRQAVRRYADEVSPTKRGERWERVRLAAFEFERLPLDIPLAAITPQHMATFRDARGSVVKPGTVLRELKLLSAVFGTCRREWGWIDTNPVHEIRKPAQPRHRERTIRWQETRAMLRVMGYRRHGRITSTGQAVAVCMLLALASGMRAGELCGLTWDRVHSRYVHLDMTKTGKTRDVPLSARAVRYIDHMRGWDDVFVFGLKTASLDALFRKYRGRAGLSGFTFHDARHTAATMMARRLDVLTLCKVFGWTSTNRALTYYNPHASAIADLLG